MLIRKAKLTKIDFEYCLAKIIEEIQIIESQEIDFENAQNGEPILTENKQENEQNILGWIYSNLILKINSASDSSFNSKTQILHSKIVNADSDNLDNFVGSKN